MYISVILISLLICIVVFETYYICKRYKYVDSDISPLNYIYDFLIHSQNTVSTYKLDNMFYVCASSTATLILLKFVYDGNEMLSDKITSSHVSSFFHGTYEYTIDASGFRINTSYYKPTIGETIICVQWIDVPVVFDNSVEKIAASYCFSKHANNVSTYMKTNDDILKYTIEGSQEMLFRVDKIDEDVKCIIYG